MKIVLDDMTNQYEGITIKNVERRSNFLAMTVEFEDQNYEGVLILKEDTKNLRNKVYRKLLFFQEKKMPVHFCLLNYPGWKNGTIKDLNEETLTLNEFKDGELMFLLEEIFINSIQAYKKPDEKMM